MERERGMFWSELDSPMFPEDSIAPILLVIGSAVVIAAVIIAWLECWI